MDTKTSTTKKMKKQSKKSKKKTKVSRQNVGMCAWVEGFTPQVTAVVAEFANVNVSMSKVEFKPRESGNQEARFLGQNGDSVFGDYAIARYLIRTFAAKSGLLGANALESSQVDQWIDFVNSRSSSNLSIALAAVNLHLKTRNFLVSGSVTLADIVMWASISSLEDNSFLQSEYADVSRWFDAVSSIRQFKISIGKLRSSLNAARANLKKAAREEKTREALLKDSKTGAKSVGKMSMGAMPDLEGVTDPTKVVTRFPPEPSGYMHIGHVKAATLNHFYAKKKYQGKLVIRMDDTNPNNEKGEFEESILADLKRLGIEGDLFTRTSDHFDAIYEYAKQAINDDLAYMDCTPHEEMKQERREKKESKFRNQDKKETLELFERMYVVFERGDLFSHLLN